METPAHSELAYSLTKYYFGNHVASVIKTLFGYDQISLKLLRSVHPDINSGDLKKALLTLVKYQLVDYVKTIKNYNQQYEYSVVPRRVFHFYRVTKFIYEFRLKEGHLSALALSTLFERGLLGEERWLQIVSSKLETNDSTIDTEEIRLIFKCLIERKFVVRIGNNVCINIERLCRDCRDDLIIETVNKFYNRDSKIKSLCKAILALSFNNTGDDAPVTAPVPLQDLKNMLHPQVFQDNAQLEKYLTKLTVEVNFRFFVSSGTHPQRGPMYALNLGLVVDHLLKEHICSVIATRFGPKCCRVFRVLLLRGPLLLKQIEECIMLPARDVREYAYMLIKEGFIRNRQVPKTPDNAPGKSVFIMSVELDRVVYNLADLSCRSISNLLTRHDLELKRNEPILTRSRAIQELLKSNNQLSDGSPTSHLEVWNEYFNSHELSQLNQINRTLDKLLFAKTQVDETLFLTHVWLRLRPNMVVEAAG